MDPNPTQPNPEALAARVDELAGAVAALIALQASQPSMGPEVIQAARELLSGLVPSPLGAISGPIRAAQKTLTKIASIVDKAATRSAGE